MIKKISNKVLSVLCLLLGLSSCQANSQSGLVSIGADDFEAKLSQYSKSKNEYVILDIRTKPEYDSGHIENAIMIDFYSRDFFQKISKLDKDKTYFIYCRSGNRSGRSLKQFQTAGFTKVFDLKGGLNSWKSRGKKIVK